MHDGGGEPRWRRETPDLGKSPALSKRNAVVLGPSQPPSKGAEPLTGDDLLSAEPLNPRLKSGAADEVRAGNKYCQRAKR